MHTDESTPTNVEPSANWQPGQRFRARKSVAHTLSGVGSILRSVARRDDVDLPDLARIAQLRQAVADAELLAVTNLRAQGFSWSDIAGALGTSKANVVQRWAHKVDGGAA
jgi:hypothetical protein